jgi:formylglycine-generating enzyme
MKDKSLISIFLIALTGLLTVTALSCKKDTDNNKQDPATVTYVQIPAGTFTMGSPLSETDRWENETQHQVSVSAFRMSKCEITNAQFAAFLNTKGIGSDGLYAAGSYPDQVLVLASDGIEDWGMHYTNNQWVPATHYESYPALYVSWYGAVEYATYAGGRLPTEAEWEYACRSNSSAPFNTGNCLTNEQANYKWDVPYGACANSSNSYPGSTQAVGTYSANSFGLYDMHGNVWEWCSDWFGDYSATAQINPKGNDSGTYRVIRGGCWSYKAGQCRSAFRSGCFPDYFFSIVGFRVVLDSR